MARRTPKRGKIGASRKSSMRSARTRSAAVSVAPPQSLIDEVDGVLSRVSPFPPNPLKRCMNLRQELGLTDAMKRGLSTALRRIAREFIPGARISDDQCAALELVEDAHVLVATKAGFSLTKACP